MMVEIKINYEGIREHIEQMNILRQYSDERYSTNKNSPFECG
jgi:hypothetical protein